MRKTERRRLARHGTRGRRGARAVVWCMICGWECEEWMRQAMADDLPF